MRFRLAFAIVVLIAFGASAAAAARLEVGQSGYLSANVLACPTLASMVSILKIAKRDFDAAVTRGVAEGCDALDKGTEVFVVEVPNASLACVKTKRVSGCLWTASDRVVPID